LTFAPATRPQHKTKTKKTSAALCIGVYWWINYMHAHLIWQPLLVLTLPPVGIGAIALALPLLSYISFQDDYRGMKPWSPSGLLAICRKTYASVDERGRVRQKNL
jgi:hypothetical protein